MLLNVKIKNRWLVVIFAIILELALGAIYAWGTYKTALTTGWTDTTKQLPFMVGLAAFAIVVVFAGRLKEKIGSQWLIIISAVCLGLGYILGGAIRPQTPVSLIFTYGLLGGAGLGFSYALPVSVGTKWFPDKKGLVVGLTMAGFGAGSLIWQYLFAGWLETAVGLGTTFIIYGVIYIFMVGASFFFLVDPPEGYTVPGWTPPQPNSAEPEKSTIGEDFTSKEMLKTKQFWFLFTTFAVGAGAGLMTISLARSWPGTFFAEGTDAFPVVFSVAVMYPLFNGLGRITWGWASDKIGWKWSLLIMNTIQTVFLFLIIVMARNAVTLPIVMAVLAFNFGGNFTLFPQATDQNFGSKNLSSNYGWVFLSYGIGGIVFPLIGGLFGGGNEIWAFVLSGILLAGCVVLVWFTKKPTKR